jgi:hypothetical protein
MRRALILCLVAVLAVLAVVSADGSSDVVSLTGSSFDTVLGGSDHVFIKFFAPYDSARPGSSVFF